MPKVSNEKKLEAVKEWLRENNIEFIENYESGFKVTMDLKIPSLMIAVFLSNDDRNREEYIYWKRGKYKQRFHWKYGLLFIRESETKEFVLEKLQNCCYRRMLRLQREWQAAKERENKKGIAVENVRKGDKA